MKTLALFLFSLSLAFAQTKVPVEQLKAKARPAPALMLVNIDGHVSLVSLGAGLALFTPEGSTQTEIRLTGPAGAVPQEIVNVPLTKQTDGTWVTAPVAGTVAPESVRLYRNGIRQKPGFDYTISAELVVTMLVTIEGDDILLADYTQQ